MTAIEIAMGVSSPPLAYFEAVSDTREEAELLKRQHEALQQLKQENR